MKDNQNQSLLNCLLDAVSHYDNNLNEEQGGVIVNKGYDFKFIPVRNKISGTTSATALYVADMVEFMDKVVSETDNNGYKIYASFHTHPKGMRAWPSAIDMEKLFVNFPINFIYAPERELNRFTFDKNKERIFPWSYKNVVTFNDFDALHDMQENMESDGKID